MAVYTLDNMVNGVHDAIAAAASLVRDQSQAADEFTEGIHDYPLIQTWAAENTGTDWTGATDRITLNGKHSIKEYLIYCDLYQEQRAHIGQAMGNLLETINEIEDILDDQGCPPFGLDYVTSFRWSWRHVAFDYGGVMYAGARFSITLRTGTAA